MEELIQLQEEMQTIKLTVEAGEITPALAIRAEEVIQRIVALMQELTPGLEQDSKNGDRVACKLLAGFDRRLAAFADLPPL